MGRRKRVLIVNCYWPETRVPMQLPNEMPMPLAPVHLAGHFAPHRWDIRLYNEVANGHLELFAPDLLSWPDVVVFCGLTAAFDRFLHLSAYFRTGNPSVVVIAGGLAVRLLPGHAATRFDYACRGDVEEIRDVIRDAFGAEFVADDPVPRYDLAHCDGADEHVPEHDRLSTAAPRENPSAFTRELAEMLVQAHADWRVLRERPMELVPQSARPAPSRDLRSGPIPKSRAGL